MLDTEPWGHPSPTVQRNVTHSHTLFLSCEDITADIPIDMPCLSGGVSVRLGKCHQTDQNESQGGDSFTCVKRTDQTIRLFDTACTDGNYDGGWYITVVF